MTATSTPNLLSRVVNQVLAIKPLWNVAKGQARHMMITRAETIGVPWRQRVQALQGRRTEPGGAESGVSTAEPGRLSPLWETDLAALQNPHVTYPNYYTTSFHAYDEGNLGWRPAMEVEVAAQAVHAKIWPESGAAGDARLRQSYHDVLTAHVPNAPNDIVDIGLWCRHEHRSASGHLSPGPGCRGRSIALLSRRSPVPAAGAPGLPRPGEFTPHHHLAPWGN